MPAQPAAIGDALGLDLSDGSALLNALRENDKIRVHADDRLEFKVRTMPPSHHNAGSVCYLSTGIIRAEASAVQTEAWLK